MELAPAEVSEDNPELHNFAFEESKVIAPGLVLTYKSIPAAAAAIVRDPGDRRIELIIRFHNATIFRDTADGFRYNEDDLEPEVKRIFPRWIPTGPHSGELLVANPNPPYSALARRFRISSGRVVKVDTIPAFRALPIDRDRDGRPEYAGYLTESETWTDEQGRQRQSYNPLLCYEVLPTGLVLDSALTRQLTVGLYGTFRGFLYAAQPGVLVSGAPSPVPAR